MSISPRAAALIEKAGLVPAHWAWLWLAAPAWLLLGLDGPGLLSHGLCVGRPADSVAAALGWMAAFAVSPAGAAYATMVLVMLAAMAPPLIYPMARHVALQSFSDRRLRSVGLWLGGYAAVWIGVFAAAPLAFALPSPLTARFDAAMAFGLAAAWQVTPAKRWALARCHRVAPIRTRGVRADASCLSFGLAHGLYCSLACAPMMIAAMVAKPHLAAMMVVGGVAVFERAARAPRFWTKAAVLAAVGLLAAAQAQF